MVCSFGTTIKSPELCGRKPTISAIEPDWWAEVGIRKENNSKTSLGTLEESILPVSGLIYSGVLKSIISSVTAFVIGLTTFLLNLDAINTWAG